MWSFLEQGSSKAFAIIVQIVLARILEPEIFGIMAILLVVINVMDVIAQSGLGAALIQKESASDASFSTGFWLSLALALAMYGLLWFLSPLIAQFYSQDDLSGYLRVAGLTIFLSSANSIFRSYLQRRMDFKTLFKSNVIAVIVSGALSITLALLGFGIWALVFQVVSQGLVALVIMGFLVPWKPHFVFSGKEGLEILSYGWKICLTGILNVLYSGISELIIGKVCSKSDLGYYSQGRKYPNAAIGVITTALSNVLFPAFSSIGNDIDSFVSAVKKALSVGTFLVAPMSLFLVVAAEPIVTLLLTDKWLPSVPIFQLVFFSSSLLMFQLVNLRAYMALGDSALYLKINIIKIVIGGTIICSVAILLRDIYCIAITACIVEILGIVFVDMPPAGRLYGYGILAQFKDQLPTYLCAIIAALCTYAFSFLPLSVVFMLLCQIAVYLIGYLLFAKVLRVQALTECIRVLRIQKNK